MNWHGSCNACTCTRDHHQPQFARSALSRAAAIGREAMPSLMRLPAATFNDTEQQTGADTARGQRAGVMCRFALAVAQDWSAFRGRAGFIVDGSPHLAVRHSTTRADRPIGSVGSRRTNFRVSQGCSPADRNSSSDNLFRHIAEHLSHSFKSSVFGVRTKAREAVNAVQENHEAGSTHDC